MTRKTGHLPIWKRKGYLRPEDLELPSAERLNRKAVAVIECPQKIPCDPCGESCPVGAIEIEGVNEIPIVDTQKCTGCSICVESCPGLAIFSLDCSLGNGCEVTLPYEFDLPEVGEEVSALNRKGEKVTTATVKRVKSRDSSAGDTPTVTIRIPDEYVKEVRNIRRTK